MEVGDFFSFMKKLSLHAKAMQQQHLHDISFTHKDVGEGESLAREVVTQLDKEIQEYVLSALLHAGYGDLKIFAEEKTPSVDLFTHTSDYEFYLDPIDGTMNFILSDKKRWDYFVKKYGKSFDYPHHFGICMGLAYQGVMQCCVLYVTTLDSMFYARRDHGAFCDGKKITVEQHDFHKEDLIFANSKYKDLDHLPDIFRDFCTVFMMSQVADGRGTAFVNQGPSLYDFAPSTLLIQEAGGFVFDEEGEEFYSIDVDEFVKKRWYVCPSSSYYEKLREEER